MPTEIGVHIRAARKRKKLSQAALAQEIGKTTRTVQNYEGGETTPDDGNLSLIAQALGTTVAALKGETDRQDENVSLERNQRTGEVHGGATHNPVSGPDEQGQPGATATATFPPHRASEGVDTPSDAVLTSLVRIKHLSVEASAGNGSEVHFEEVDGETFLPASYVRQEFGVSPERVKRIRVHGNSMLGTVNPGQLVYVVLMEPGQQPIHGGVYVIRGPHGLLIKRLYFESEGGECWVRIHSDNPEAGTDRVPLEVFHRDYTPIAHFRSVQTYL